MPADAHGPEAAASCSSPRDGPGHVPSSASRPRPAPASSRPASYPSPTGPALRANPFPEVTDLICRLPLPTLFYHQRLFTLETCCGYGYGPARKSFSPQDFQGPTGVHQTPQEPRCFTGTGTLSPGEPFPGCTSLTKKRELFLGLPPASPGSFALPHWTPRGRYPCPGSGILTRFPFDSVRAPTCCCFAREHRPSFRTEFPYLLGPTDPCSTAVHMEPFSTSVFKVLV